MPRTSSSRPISSRESGAEPRWRAVERDEWIGVEVGDVLAVYHRPSGKTHFLNRAAWLLLTEILRLPCDAQSAALALRRGSLLDGVSGSDDAEEIDAARLRPLLVRLEELGLLHRS